MNGHNKELSSYLVTPGGMAHTAIDTLTVRHQNEQQQAVTYKFEFRYKGKGHHVQVIAHTDATRSEIEDRAAAAAESWMLSIDEEEYKRPPTEDEKKQIGKALNEVYLNMQKRRESSNGRIYYNGVN